MSTFLSTPSARRATRDGRSYILRREISIHALCEEGDLTFTMLRTHPCYISIHALCEEGDIIGI